MLGVNDGLRLQTLGAPSLLRSARDGAILMTTSKPLALLTYAVITGGPTSREHLIDLLWAGTDPAHARQTLRQTLWQLRRVLGDGSIESRGEFIHFSGDIQADRNDFVAAIDSGDFERAVAAYTGDFCADFAAPGAAAFEQWADVERARLRSAFCRALEILARLEISAGHWRAAKQLATRLRDTQPRDEASWRLLLEACVAGEDRVAGIVEAEALEQWLTSSGRSPEPATVRLLRAIRQQKPAIDASAAVGLIPEMVGREREFSTLVQAWDQASAGATHRVSITAPAGMGKTRLLLELRNRIRGAGGTAVYVRAAPGDRQLSLGFVARMVQELAIAPGAKAVSPGAAAALVSLNPSLSALYAAPMDTTIGPEAKRRRALALGELMSAIADESPLALFLDDLHWADQESAEMLTALLGNLREATLVVWAERPQNAHLREGAWRAVDLPPLDALQCESLLMSLGTLPTEQWANRLVLSLHQASKGSPLLLLETLHLAIETGVLRLDEGRWVCADPSALLTLVQEGSALQRRVQLVRGLERDVLLVLATAGSACGIHLLCGALLQDPNSALLALEQQGFVRHASEGWEITHDEIASAILQGSTPPAVREAHKALADALTIAADASLERVTRAVAHLIEAGREDKLASVYVRELTRARERYPGSSDRDIAALILGKYASTARIKALRDARPLAWRLGAHSLGRVAILAGLAVVGALGLGRFVATRFRAAQLAVIEAPLSAQIGLVPAPVIEVQDSRGRRVVDASDTVVAEVVGVGRLLGTTRVRADSGRARFTDLQVDSAMLPLDIRFRSGSLRTTGVTIPSTASALPVLELVGADLNGTKLKNPGAVLVVRRGERIRGRVALRYSSYWGAAAVMLGAAYNWAPREGGVVSLAPLVTPAVNRGLTVSLDIPGPKREGRYSLVIFFGAEPDVRWTASGTNWTVGHPIWGDGNDIAEWSVDQVQQARTRGRVETTIVRRAARMGDVVPATVVDIIARR